MHKRYTLQNKLILHNSSSNIQYTFHTQQFRELVVFLSNNNSIILLYKILNNCYTIDYQSMPSHYYIQALHYNFDNIHTPSQSSEHSRIWYQELLYRIYQKMAYPNTHTEHIHSMINITISKIKNEKLAQGKTHYLYKKINNTLKANTKTFTNKLTLQILIQHTQEMLNDLFQYFSINKNNTLCTLLMFYGIDIQKIHAITLPKDPTSIVILQLYNEAKNISSTTISYTKNYFHNSTHDNLSELDYQIQIATTIVNHITALQYKKRQRKLFLKCKHPWYYVLLKQFYKFTITKINISITELKKIDYIFEESIKYGDCITFFSNFNNITKQHNSIFSYNKTLIKNIKKIENLYHCISFDNFINDIERYKSIDTIHKHNTNDFNKKNKIASYSKLCKAFIRKSKKPIISIKKPELTTVITSQIKPFKSLLSNNTHNNIHHNNCNYNCNLNKSYKSKSYSIDNLKPHTKDLVKKAFFSSLNNTTHLHSKFYVEKPSHRTYNTASNSYDFNSNKDSHNKSKNKSLAQLSHTCATIDHHTTQDNHTKLNHYFNPSTTSMYRKIVDYTNKSTINKKLKHLYTVTISQKRQSKFYVETPTSHSAYSNTASHSYNFNSIKTYTKNH
ncbi:hypothetical protein [Candidatus Neoehrlichia procyonis]|uniref:Uncharacterized protein n=1 Tax=Candidatus Neoehrlichia procyonis str. RAC413 TaxID=1359163 RepID=A0A0F3NNE5_9RICK|nr:hypothetical protein [Candidatus Neoehrlichia lotoris]KJV69222.1 hypothetical protein NLO413_0603 [Candidatus Neoehrlichia lotoris str. RAC413]